MPRTIVEIVTGGNVIRRATVNPIGIDGVHEEF